jgi:menaquinone-dependent protoporphyrinogen IX oxidase
MPTVVFLRDLRGETCLFLFASVRLYRYSYSVFHHEVLEEHEVLQSKTALFVTRYMAPTLANKPDVQAYVQPSYRSES